MTEEEQRADVTRELERADQALATARDNRKLGHHDGALDRTYYAAFHGATALLISEGVTPRRPRAIAGLLTQYASAVLTAEDVTVFAQLATQRELADYNRWFKANDAVVVKALADAEAFVAKVKAHLVERGGVAEAGGEAPR